MKILNVKLTFALMAGVLLAFAGCGGSDGGGSGGGISFAGNTAPATIDDTNAESIGTAAGEIVQNAGNSGLPTTTPAAFLGTGSIDMEEINNIVLSHANPLNLPVGVDYSSNCPNSGSFTITGIPSSSNPSGPVTLTVTYNNCVSGSTTFNGSATIHYNDLGNLNAGYSIQYSNFTISDPAYGTVTYNLSLVCTSASYTSCTYNSDIVAEDGATHRVSNVSIIGNATSGFTGSATFYHSTYGEVTLTITGVTYGSCGNHPDGGEISFTSSNGSSGTIMFNSDCTVSGTWSDGAGNSASF